MSTGQDQLSDYVWEGPVIRPMSGKDQLSDDVWEGPVIYDVE